MLELELMFVYEAIRGKMSEMAFVHIEARCRAQLDENLR
jgi:hypothetical protein